MAKALSKQLRINPFALPGGKTLIFFKFSNLRREAYISFLLSSLRRRLLAAYFLRKFLPVDIAFLVFEYYHEPQPRDKKNVTDKVSSTIDRYEKNHTYMAWHNKSRARR